MGGDDLISLWELGAGRTPSERSLALLSAACPKLSYGELAALSLGQCNVQLLALRERLFGDVLPVLANCPSCGALSEFDASTRQLRADAKTAPPPLRLQVGSLTIDYRLVTSEDLLAVAPIANPDAALRRLLSRCVLGVMEGEDERSPLSLSEEVVEELARSMSEHDTGAEVMFTLICPKCATRWKALLEIANYLWTELSAHVQRLVEEVHKLASSYGWREEDVLKMSAQRRYLYLRLVGA